MRDEPVAVDLPKARRPPNPVACPVPILQRAADPIEAVPECHVAAQRDREVVNLVTERTLVGRKSVLIALSLISAQRKPDLTPTLSRISMSVMTGESMEILRQLTDDIGARLVPGTPEQIEAEVRRLQLEGVIAKRQHSRYEPGRRSHA
jgi:hypothetical protein